MQAEQTSVTDSGYGVISRHVTSTSVHVSCMETRMGFKAVTATMAEFYHLLIGFLLLTGAGSTNVSLNITNTTSSPLLQTESYSCVFPNFLQTNCSGPSKVCEWNLGKRIALPRWQSLSPPSKFRAIRGTSEWIWVVVNSTIVIKRTVVASLSQPLSRVTHRVFQCITNTLDKNTFIISKKEKLGEKEDANVTFSCIRFLKRSRNVIQYKLGNWNSSFKDVECQDNGLALQEYLLISDHSHGILDCPFELTGAYEILSIYDAKGQRTCTSAKGSFGLLESDCLSKEGLYIDFGTGHNCTNPDIGNRFPFELNLGCHSKPWKDGIFTYVVTSRRARWLHEYEKTTFQCIRFETASGLKNELTLTVFNEPICKRLINNGERLEGNDDMFSLRIRQKKKDFSSKPHLNSRCKFPNEFQGSWIEQSVHEGRKEITIKGGNITINPYGSFECKERFSLSQGHPSICGFGAEGDRWLGQGQVRFFYGDYTLVSRFTNGCRARITRLGLTKTVDEHVLIYRLSQSEPTVNDGKSPDDYYKHEILKRFCGMPYVYQRDSFPYWGRNIEKVIHREQLPVQPMSKCSLVFNSKHDLLSVVASSDSTSCRGMSSMLRFGCQESRGAMTTLKVLYNPSCKKKDLSFLCLGKAWKFGNYVLLRDSVTQQINCVWFDKESNAMFRLDSSQCSDAHWGRLPGHTDKFAERFEIKYFEKCPLIEPVEPTNEKGRSSAAVIAVNHVVWLSFWIVTARVWILNQQ
jgi:hypothetical protein